MASPSKNQNYAYLSRLSTQKLLELLAAAPAPAETPEDKAYIDAIVEVVLEREERHPTGLLPDPEQAWEEFQQYYNTPEGEDQSLYPAENPGTAPSEPAPSQTEYRPQRRPKRHFFRRVVIVAAVVVCIALPPALGFENVFQMFGAWTDEVFVLIDTYNILDSREETNAECNELNIQEILKEAGIAGNIVPAWIPSGFILDSITVSELQSPDRVEVRTYYTWDDFLITIVYSKYIESNFDTVTTFEKDSDAVEKYNVKGIVHYLFKNIDKQVAVWNQGNVECVISGNISYSDLKKMIDSIYDGG
ncbi:MAG: DUF4367 domain-containing protein [Flavonifractor plautii]|uniref:DUF4367 domain-containing protein n=1 Tax=Flavonifractor plautii TaxID=292800 RepID=UPI00189C5651|nr:DUF4367 domain-containing protein [Flavonifractor plautii]